MIARSKIWVSHFVSYSFKHILWVSIHKRNLLQINVYRRYFLMCLSKSDILVGPFIYGLSPQQLCFYCSTPSLCHKRLVQNGQITAARLIRLSVLEIWNCDSDTVQYRLTFEDREVQTVPIYLFIYLIRDFNSLS